MADPNAPKGWRYHLGFWMFTIPFGMIIGAPIIVPFLVPSATEAAAIVGAIVIIGEVVWFASIPLLGKAGFKELKGKAFGFFALPRGPIGRERHAWGLRFLGLFLLLETVAVLGILAGYFYLGEDNLTGSFIGLTFQQEARLFIGLIAASGVCLLIAVYTLGAPFVGRLADALSWTDDAEHQVSS